MYWDDFQKAFNEAKHTLEQADSLADRMLGVLAGRLRRCGGYRLAKLKAELRDFDSRTRKWKK